MELDDKHLTIRAIAVAYLRLRLKGLPLDNKDVCKLSDTIDDLQKDCAECCDQCSAIFCPYDEPLHGHHDGCPACELEVLPDDPEVFNKWQHDHWQLLLGKNTMPPMQPEQPTVKAIEGMRIKPGDTLVMIPERNLTLHQFERLNSDCQMVGLKLLYLPAGTKLYIKES